MATSRSWQRRLAQAEGAEARTGWARRVAATGARFDTWCTGNGIPSHTACYEAIAGYLSHYVDRNRGSAKSVRNVLSQLRVFFRGASRRWLTTRDQYRLKRTVAALEYQDATPTNTKKPATLRVLAAMHKTYDPHRPDHLLLELSLHLGHNGLLRAAELHSGLRVRDLTWDFTGRQVTLSIARSKTHRRGAPEEVTVRDYRGRSAYKLLVRWMDSQQLWSHPSAYILPRLGRDLVPVALDFEHPMVRARWVKEFRHHLHLAGYVATEYSGHSLRAGGATDLFSLGVSYPIIKKAGRWRSEAALRYFREEDQVANTVALAFGNAVQQNGEFCGR